jgi:hypothetical protein
VLDHIFDWCNVGAENQRALNSLLGPKGEGRQIDDNASRAGIRRILTAAMQSKHGAIKADALIRSLFDLEKKCTERIGL